MAPYAYEGTLQCHILTAQAAYIFSLIVNSQLAAPHQPHEAAFSIGSHAPVATEEQ